MWRSSSGGSVCRAAADMVAPGSAVNAEADAAGDAVEGG